MTYTIAPMVHPEVADAPYFIEILKKLKDKLSDDYHFIIARTNTEEEKMQFKTCIKNGKKNILIFLSDERGILPPFLNKLHLVFRTYSNSNLHDNEKIFAVPCGFSCGYGGYFGNSEWKYKNSESEKIPLKDREFDIFISAQISPNRQLCINSLNNIKDEFKTIMNITDGFAKGFKLEDYYSYMSNSKISIVPDGVVVPESFRYFESFESNCVVITTFPKNSHYGNWFYEDSPAIFLNNWSELNSDIINYLLQPKILNTFDNKNKKYFNENISTDAITNYIYKILVK